MSVAARYKQEQEEEEEKNVFEMRNVELDERQPKPKKQGYGGSVNYDRSSQKGAAKDSSGGKLKLNY